MSLFFVTYYDDDQAYLVEAPNEETAKDRWLANRNAAGFPDLDRDGIGLELIPFDGPVAVLDLSRDPRF